jgi:phasin family protein
MATYGAKRPARKLPPKAVATPPQPAPLSTPVEESTAMTAVEAAPAIPPADIAAAPLAEIPDPAPVVIEPATIEPAAPAEPEPAKPAVLEPVEQIAEAIETIAPVTSPITAIVTTQKESIMDATTAATATTEKTQAFFADATDRTRGAMEKGTKFFHEITEFSKGNVEAVVESSKIAARGFETLGQDAAAYAKTSFESASEAMRTLATLKSPTEFMKFQADYVRSVFDSMVAQTSRGTEATLKLAGDVAQPISNRVAVAAEKMKVVA